MAKKIKAIVKLNVKGGQATAAPPVGPTLSQNGIQIMDFIKTFNERTKDQQGAILPVVITVFEDRTYAFHVKKQPVAQLIKKALNLEKASQAPGKSIVAKLSRDAAAKIAEEKMVDLRS